MYKIPQTCPECESTDIEWSADVETASAAVDGRLRMHEVSPVIILGCNECSATVDVVRGRVLDELLNFYVVE